VLIDLLSLNFCIGNCLCPLVNRAYQLFRRDSAAGD
jgi:hypothetical protein